MRSLFLITGTNEVPKYADSLRNLGLGEVGMVAYDTLGRSDKVLYDNVKAFGPNFVVHIGSRWGQLPSMSTLARINANVAPMMHLCSDAADQPWFDLLREYHMAGCFTLQVAIDGSRKWPLSDSQMTALTPVDGVTFQHGDKPHAARGVMCGYAGNPGCGPGSKRTDLLVKLLEAKAIDMRARTNLPHTYEAFCDFLQNCRMSVNIAYSGTEAALQVKGRVLESALAGSLLLETADSPTRDWFTPGIDYLEYRSAADLTEIIESLRDKPDLTQRIAMSLRSRVMTEHSPERFWKRCFLRMGITP